MAKTRTKARSKPTRDRDILRTSNTPLVKSPMKPKKPQKSIADLLTDATTLLEQSQPELALPIAEEALRRLEEEKRSQNGTGAPFGDDDIPVPPAVVLVGETQLAIGDVDAARLQFLHATELDADGTIVSAEPWLWLAQLSEEGGAESVGFFVKATEILRREIGFLQGQTNVSEDVGVMVEEKQAKLADALCGMAEVYMTDLSWEEDAETKCERLVTEALAVVPEGKSAGTLQCLASVRISQERMDEARGALRKSLEVWRDDEEAMPDFPSRISLSRLLMEVDMLTEAVVVLDGLIIEDDQSVEAWYLGGWCQVLRSQEPDLPEDTKQQLKEGARQWLRTCLRLYQAQDYEDERLKEHATELTEDLDRDLGMGDEDEVGDDEENEWEDDDPILESDAESGESQELDEDVDMS